ncbi:hypothetical protein PG985_008542 [Apiospora marii]|uniref:Uncharacterized protein n=1 Tax=Apiospora marii TaxID=335849 RepID=A0ABR1R3H6_9PEZI
MAVSAVQGTAQVVALKMNVHAILYQETVHFEYRTDCSFHNTPYLAYEDQGPMANLDTPEEVEEAPQNLQSQRSYTQGAPSRQHLARHYENNTYPGDLDLHGPALDAYGFPALPQFGPHPEIDPKRPTWLCNIPDPTTNSASRATMSVTIKIIRSIQKYRDASLDRTNSEYGRLCAWIRRDKAQDWIHLFVPFHDS